MVHLSNWSILTDIGTLGDPLRVGGHAIGHPTHGNGFIFPGTFLSFDLETRTALSLSGTPYYFEKHSFNPNGNAKTEEEAFEWIKKNYVRTSRGL